MGVTRAEQRLLRPPSVAEQPADTVTTERASVLVRSAFVTRRVRAAKRGGQEYLDRCKSFISKFVLSHNLMRTHVGADDTPEPERAPKSVIRMMTVLVSPGC